MEKAKYATKDGETSILWDLFLTVINNFYCGLIKVKIDYEVYSFKLGETYFNDPKYVIIITETEWSLVKALKRI